MTNAPINSNFFTNEVIINFSMLCSCMNDWVKCKVQVTNVVTEKHRRPTEANTDIKQEITNPSDLCGGGSEGSILYFGT